MRYLIALLLAVSISACSPERAPLQTADYADALTTAVGVAQGATEANPVIGFAGDAAAPVVALGVKYGLRNGLPMAGVPQEGADAIVDAVGWIGACSNAALLASVAAFPTTLYYGAACGAVSLYTDRQAFTVQ